MSKRAWTGIAVALGVALVVAVWFVNSPTDGRRETNTLRVGLVLPLTGSLASYGSNAKDGIELAAKELNDSSSKTGGTAIRLVVEDSKGEPQQAVSALQKLVTVDRVSCVIGDVASSATLAMAPIANRNKVVLLSPAASAPAITTAGEFVFRDWPSDAFEASVMAGYMKEKPYRKIAVLFVNNDYGQAMLHSFTSLITSFGGSIVATESFQDNSTDLRAQITKLAAVHPEVVYLISYPKDTIVFLRQYTELGVHIPLVSTSSFQDPRILESEGATAEGVVFTSPIPPAKEDPVVAGFRASYVKMFGKDPGLVADYGYDALKLLAEAARISGGIDGEHLRSGLEKIKDFHGASGLINFDRNGDVLKAAGLKTVKDGKFVWLQQPGGEAVDAPGAY